MTCHIIIGNTFDSIWFYINICEFNKKYLTDRLRSDRTDCESLIIAFIKYVKKNFKWQKLLLT